MEWKSLGGIKMKILKLFVSLTLMVTILTGCSSAKEDDSVVIGTQSMPNDEGIAKALGYFEEEMGVDVKLKTFDSGRDVATALMTEDIDFGLLGSCPAALAIAQGAEVEYIWTHEVLGSVESLVVKGDINNAQDLIGKTIATPFASTAHFSLLKYLQINDIKSDQVTILDMQPAEIYTAWQSNQIDGAYIWQPTLAQLTDQKVLVTSGDLANQGYMTANVELVTKAFAKKHPELVEKYISALNKSVELYKNDQDKAVSAVAKYLELEKDDALFQMSGSIWLDAQEQIDSKYMGTTSKKGDLVDNLVDIAKYLKDQGSITTVPKKSVFEAAVNPSYAQKVSEE